MILLFILGVIASAIGGVLYYSVGLIANVLGFTAAGIIKGSIAAYLMSCAWVSGLFMPVISFLQAAGVAFGTLAASCGL